MKKSEVLNELPKHIATILISEITHTHTNTHVQPIYCAIMSKFTLLTICNVLIHTPLFLFSQLTLLAYNTEN